MPQNQAKENNFYQIILKINQVKGKIKMIKIQKIFRKILTMTKILKMITDYNNIFKYIILKYKFI